jgi:hypothetical protein
MLINHTKKYVYLRVPKTGSTSFESQLIEEVDNKDDVSHSSIPFCSIAAKNWVYPLGLNRAHITPEEIQNMMNVDITEYDIYGVLRHPVDRFLSRAFHLEYFNSEDNKNTTKPGTTLDKNLVAEKWLKTFDEQTIHSPENVMFWSQQKWLVFRGELINNLFLYENISDMMKKITGNSTLRYNYRGLARVDKSYEDLDADLTQQIIKIYASDYGLYNSLKNNLK